MMNRIVKEESGVLTFEWILLLTVLVIGITGGLSCVRDAVITELGDVSEAMIALDQSYYILAPWEINTPDGSVWDGGIYSFYRDSGKMDAGRVGSGGEVGGPGTRTAKPKQTMTDDQNPENETGIYK
ncbi:MAG: hypothetical protein Q4C96_05305 [Planctomycetia bacterium]|nr:hypothetical protein [Planctomycetia bacterium]